MFYSSDLRVKTQQRVSLLSTQYRPWHSNYILYYAILTFIYQCQPLELSTCWTNVIRKTLMMALLGQNAWFFYSNNDQCCVKCCWYLFHSCYKRHGTIRHKILLKEKLILNQLNTVHPFIPYPRKKHVNIIFPSIPACHKWIDHCRFFDSIFKYIPHRFDACYIPRLPHHHSFNQPNNIWWMQTLRNSLLHFFSSAFSLLGPSVRQHSVLKHPQSALIP
jgi:hypothetical protein